MDEQVRCQNEHLVRDFDGGLILIPCGAHDTTLVEIDDDYGRSVRARRDFDPDRLVQIDQTDEGEAVMGPASVAYGPSQVFLCSDCVTEVSSTGGVYVEPVVVSA